MASDTGPEPPHPPWEKFCGLARVYALSQGRFLGQGLLGRPRWSQVQATLAMFFTELWDERPRPSSSIPGPYGGGVSAHLLREPREEVPATQEVQNKIELSLSLEGWGEGKRQWHSQSSLGPCPSALSSLGLLGMGATSGKGSPPQAGQGLAGRLGTQVGSAVSP